MSGGRKGSPNWEYSPPSGAVHRLPQQGINHGAEQSGKEVRVNRPLTAIGSTSLFIACCGDCSMKTLIIAATALAALATATSASAQATSSNPRATANARLIKPLTLTRVQDLNFGTIVMGTLNANETVSMDLAGALTCGSSGNLTCAATGQTARFTITGTQGQQVTVSAPAGGFPLTGSNGGTLTFTPSLPGTLTLGNSGAPGNTFSVGGNIVIAANQQDGVYTGQIDIQVNY
jgi:hypothetical protein